MGIIARRPSSSILFYPLDGGGCEAGRYSLERELGRGGIRGRGPLPASEVTRILREVSWALAYAHAQGVVHRDIKADNILLEAGSGRALVADFGIARHTEATGVTAVGEVVGTAEYMSPEQASGEAVDGRSDIYSLGVLGFYALSGRPPFEGPNIASVLAQHITQPAPPVAAAAHSVPSRLARAIDRCLRKAPAERFQKAEDLAEGSSAWRLSGRSGDLCPRNGMAAGHARDPHRRSDCQCNGPGTLRGVAAGVGHGLVSASAQGGLRS